MIIHLVKVASEIMEVSLHAVHLRKRPSEEGWKFDTPAEVTPPSAVKKQNDKRKDEVMHLSNTTEALQNNCTAH